MITAGGPTEFCVGGNVTLNITGTSGGSTFQWQKDGADIPGATVNNYVATTTGSYTIIVTQGSTPTIYGPVAVTASTLPVASFTSTPGNQCSTIPVSFTNTSSGIGLTYSWNFGDPNSGGNNASTTTHPTHTFIGTPGNSPQSFTVTLVADNAGCTNTASATITTSQIPDVKLGGTGFTTYNGLPYFTQCTSVPSTFTFTNQSSTTSTNTNYVIVWGDASPDFTSSSFSSTTHTYPVGNYQLQFIVTGQNGCKDTGRYNVFVGNNPAVGLNNPGNTFICSQTSLTFPISGTTNNPPGTVYAVSFNDGSSAVTYTHPAPADVTHFFSKGSCGTNSGNSPVFPNSFQATIQASNPCGTSAASVVPIYVSDRTKASMAISPDTVVCTSTTVTVTNNSGNGFGISGSGSNAICTPGKGIWTITPSTGWTLNAGSLGSDFGFTDPSLWTNGSPSLSIKFNTPGNYSIKLKTGATQLCGGDSVIRTICVNPAPVAAFALSANTGCAPLTVTTTNNSNTPLCKTNTYQWSVSYSNTSGCTPGPSGFTYINGTSATSAAPQFSFTNPGVYTISLVTTNSMGLCTSAAVSQIVTVKTKPQGSINAPNAVCQNGSINPSAMVNNCYATNAATYLWSFPGGSPATSTSSSPGPIVYNTSGSYTIALEVTNECGTTTITKNILVNAAPNVSVPANKTFCAGEQTGALTFTGSVGGTIFTWTNSNTAIGLAASGTGSIPNFTTTNASAFAITAIIMVTPTSGCSGSPQSFTITVNPRPAKPSVIRPVIYCLNETASPLTATATSGNTINWYTVYPLSGATTISPVPSTTTQGSTTYYVTQGNSFNCESDTAKIIVTVNPKIANNIIGIDQTICNGSNVQPLASQSTITGGSGTYQYQWQRSTDGGLTWTNITGATSPTYNPGTVAADIKYRRVVNSASCSDTSNIVNIVVQGSLANVGIGIAQTICTGSQPDTLRGQLPTGGNGSFTYQWESSLNNTTWTLIAGAGNADYYPPVLITTTYYRRKVSSGQCSVYSSSVMITVNPKPLMTAIADKYFCNSNVSGIISFSSTPAASSYAWINDNTAIGLAASGSGNITSFTTTNNSSPKVPVTAKIKLAPTFTNNGVSCVGDTASFKIIVLPTITVTPINSEVKCTGQTIPFLVPIPDTSSFPGISIQYSWTVTGGGITLPATGNGSLIPSYTTVNNGSADLTATITVTPKYTYAGKTCDGTPTSYTITVKPATANANAGIDQTLCAQSSASLSATVVNGTAGLWSQVGAGATITSPTSNITTVTGLTPGTIYRFVWTQTGFAFCPATTDTVVIDNKLPLENKIDTATQTICAGVTINIAGFVPTGGGGAYTYHWESSTDGINFTAITGAALQNIMLIPTTTVWLRRFVNALPCSGYSDTVKINVQPALANNLINADATICTGLVAPAITASFPTGGNNSFTYVWQQSTNGGVTWTVITGATAVDYSPGILIQTTKYRRIVSTSLCSGSFGSTSNTVTITVNPDAKAFFVPTDTIRCPPFIITPAVINLQTSTANSQYLWYANGTLIGAGTIFPGYTVANENDSVIIKLKVISTYGCKNDSLEQKFKTIKKPTPSFTLSDTVGCGPLTVLATNTSTYINEYTYFWDFGNGQTSTAIQPSAIVFAPNPTYGDTTYIVKLKVFSPCDTLTFSKSIRVKSKPRALFTPTKTVGCSPMTVTFKNTSKGINNTYFWDFGDGTTFSTVTPDTVQHTFITGVVDTFYVKLKVVNECGEDSLTYSIIVAPNTIKLNLAVNGTQHFGCEPHPVAFINNSQGASVFSWNFGDGATTTTSKNVDTVYHTYQTPGTYTVSLQAINNCSDTTTTETITVYPTPRAAFTADKFTICKGDTVRFTNLSGSATAHLWQFGDGLTSTLTNPTHFYSTPGTYIVKLITYRNNPSGNVCSDSTLQPITVTATQTGFFAVSDSVGQCAPFTVTFVNKNRPSVTAAWDFGDGGTATGDSVVHTFQTFGTYNVKLTVTVPGGCTYITHRPVVVNGPGGTLQYTGGYNCYPAAIQLQAVATGATTYLWNFGDGNTLSTTQQVVYHSYANPGFYLPKVTLQNAAGCNVLLQGIDTIKVDKIDGGFTFAKNEICGSTTLNFSDTSRAFFGKQSARWSFGDGTFGTGISPSHNYTAGGTYIIEMIVAGNSGCTDTVTKQIDVLVKSKPVVSIDADTTACTRKGIQFTGVIQSADAINLTQWNISNGASGVGPVFNHIFTLPGTYTIRLVVGTVNGCFDTAYHTITINPTPVVVATQSLDLCRGNTVQLNASGATTYQWSPLQGLSCSTCFNPIASPIITTPYVVEGKNSFGCADYDTVIITVIQPLRVTVSPSENICIGSSTNLLASGATSYSWSPAIGLNSTTISNPTASPAVTTTYRVVGYDGYNCFTDTAFVTVGVGQYPTINLGPDLILPAGTLHQLTSTVTNGPITKWLWMPSTNLSCNTCAVPTAEIKKNISYSVLATTAYGCTASDTINIKVTCSDEQVYIPNAFSPDGDGINDVLMVRASGIVTVKYFRIFNRWGELVFEKSNFTANNPLYGWNGKVKGVVGGPDVFVYTCEALCENGTSFTYKGNVSIIK
jgi:PKD repeat protein